MKYRYSWLSAAISSMILFSATSSHAIAETTNELAKTASVDEKNADKWDVNNPPGEEISVEINTNQSTWSNVDVSPDGKSIVFDMLGDLYLIPVKGGKAVALTHEMAWNMQPRFSPNGKQIAFISDRDGGDNLWLMDIDGTNLKQVSKEKRNLVHTPNWSPDGNYLVAKKGFVSARSIAAGEIWLFHKSGGDGYQLKERIGGENAQKNIAEPAFSPDGRYVYYSVDSTPGTAWEYNKNPTSQIFTIHRLDRHTGEDITFVSGAGGAIAPTPSSDGKYLAFVKRVDTRSVLFIKDLKTGIDTPLYTELDRDLQETNGSHGNTPQFDWSPDNKSIVFWSGGKIHQVSIKDKKLNNIAFTIKTDKKVTPAVRFAVEVAPDEFDVKMIRWAQMSPKGDQIVFQALGKIYLQNVKTGKQKRLTKQEDDFEFYPTFSSDGKSIAYVTWNDKNLGSVKIIASRGGRAKTISTEPGHYVEPAFSNDNNKVVFRRFSGGYLTSPEYSMEPGLYVALVDEDKMWRVHEEGINPHFSSDGQRILFSSFDWGAKGSVASIRLDGEDLKEHISGNDITEFKVSPDGQWIAFAQQYNAYIAPFTLTGKSESLTSATTAVPVNQISKRSGEFLHWSADSKKVGWSHGSTFYSRELKDTFDYFANSPETLPEPESEGVDLSFKATAYKPKGVIALVGADIVTMQDAANQQEVIKNGIILVEGNHIIAVGEKSEISIPDNAFQVDLSGKTITPGMVDVHAHGGQASNEINPQQNWSSFSSLAFGVTTIHDPSNDSTEIFSASELQKTGQTIAPRIFSTGTILYGAKAAGYTANIDNYEDAKFHLQRLKELGAISVKSYNQPRRDQKQQVIAAGKELGIMVVPEGGAKFYHNMTMVVDGHTGVEHSLPIANIYEDVKQLWSQTDVGYTPTFGVAYGGLSGETYWYDRTNVWQNEQLMRYTPNYLVEPNAIRRSTAPDSHYNHFNVAKAAKQLNDRGVAVQIGAHGQREGLAAHWELWMLQQGGFTPWQALRAATIDGAKYLGMDKNIGSIEVGKLADLMIIDGDVLNDIRQSEKVVFTMINGRLFETKSMNEVANKNAFKRQPFFFETLNMQSLPEASAKALQTKQQQYHWRH